MIWPGDDDTGSRLTLALTVGDLDPVRAHVSPRIIATCDGLPFRREQEKVSIEASERGGDVADAAGIPIGRRAHRRGEYEVLGLLLGVFSVLFVLAVILGAAPRA